jgi:hypothetical protein
MTTLDPDTKKSEIEVNVILMEEAFCGTLQNVAIPSLTQKKM